MHPFVMTEDQTSKANKMAEDHLLSFRRDGRPLEWYEEFRLLPSGELEQHYPQCLLSDGTG